MLEARSDVAAISNPKVTAADPSRQFYPYYAGFSEAFVEDAVKWLGIRPGATILDPWNGSGTTTTVACRHGLRAYGIDLNPALTLIAKARSIPTRTAIKLLDGLRKQIRAVTTHFVNGVDPADPLLRWFGAKTVAAIRGIEQSLIGSLTSDKRVEEISDEDALAYLLLFRTLRRHGSALFSSNPTWVRNRPRGRQIGISSSRLIQSLLRDIDSLRDHLAAITYCNIRPTLVTASSTALREIEDEFFDAVVTSPPYCTRIDYAVAMSLELSVLATRFSFDFEKLRKSLLGTTITSSALNRPCETWPDQCQQFLRLVRGHVSKASASYYHRYYTGYFAGLFRSLDEIHRVTRARGTAIIVAQTSNYKELQLDLPGLITDFQRSKGWTVVRRTDYPVRVSFSKLNPHTKRYTSSLPIEAVLCFRKE
jgi:DNA modification methylase